MNSSSPQDTFAKHDHLGFLRESHPFLLYFLALIVGIISTFSTIGFIWSYVALRKLIYQTDTFNFILIAKTISPLYFLVAFIVGGTLMGLFSRYVIPPKGIGIIHLIYNYRHQLYLSVREGLSTTFASIFSIAMGASVGQEAPIMYFAGSLASWFCEIFKLHGHYFRVLLGAAAAASMATSFDTVFMPLFFVLEVYAFSLSALDLIPIAIAIFSSVLIKYLIPNILPWFSLPTPVGALQDFFPFILLGVLCTFMAILFIQSLRFTIIARHNSSLPKAIWPLLGGLALTLVALFYPSCLGLSLGIVQFDHPINTSFNFVLGFVIFKFLATYFSVGFGYHGGVITPIFVTGIFFGILYCLVLQNIFTPTAFNIDAYAMASASIMTGLSLGAPLSFIMYGFERSHDLVFTTNLVFAMLIGQIIMKSFKIIPVHQYYYNYMYHVEK